MFPCRAKNKNDSLSWDDLVCCVICGPASAGQRLLTPRDAERAIAHARTGSRLEHGGRNFDSSMAPIEALAHRRCSREANHGDHRQRLSPRAAMWSRRWRRRKLVMIGRATLWGTTVGGERAPHAR